MWRQLGRRIHQGWKNRRRILEIHRSRPKTRKVKKKTWNKEKGKDKKINEGETKQRNEKK